MPIDRKSIIDTYAPVVKEWDPASFLSVGNGEFATTVDCTGLQTISPTDEAATPLATMATWGMHNYPGALPKRYDLLKRKMYESAKGQVGYMSDDSGQEKLFEELRVNAHRFNLVRFSLYEEGVDESQMLSLIDNIEQRLDLYRGVITSSYTYRSKPVAVKTVVHPDQDQLSLSLTSEANLSVLLSFPYPSHLKEASNWEAEALHTTALQHESEGRWTIERTADEFVYRLEVQTGQAVTLKQIGTHQVLVSATGNTIEVNLGFTHQKSRPCPVVGFDACESASSLAWHSFWEEGGFVDVSASTDSRKDELQRRILLSRYLLAIQCSGSTPPPETGLTCNSWYGKFHLEMHLLHAAHFPLWGQAHLLERSLSWYTQILGGAYERAKEQGYAGARWPKMTEADGSDAPSAIGTLLCWQQPHPIFYAALLRSYNPTSPILPAWEEVLEATATFMVDYVVWDEETGHYTLGPPVIPVQENHDPTEVLNPTFELAYWRWALNEAITMREEGGKSVDPLWREVLEKLAPLPSNGSVYLAHQKCPDTYGSFAEDHPSLLFALSLFDGGDVDHQVMKNSLDEVIKRWRLNELWGWDFPLMAMCAARLGETELAMDLLLMESPKNTYTPNGHNAQLPKSDLPLYLPGNGALLLAVALMASGWKGSEGEAPGFPKTGWTVRSEGVFPLF
ncbi:MAG: hypothetical protein WC233_08140 [Sphaerochaeta sp.]|jgi:hypothetical protein